MDKLTIISGCLFLAADIFAIASIANPDWINTGESAGPGAISLLLINFILWSIFHFSASQKRFRDLNSITELNNTVHPSGRQLGAAAVPADRGAGAGGPRRHLLQREVAGALTVGLVRQCQTIHGRDRTCIPPRLPPEWVTTLFFIIMGIISLTVTCGLLVASHWRREATKYARWIAFTGSIGIFYQIK
ncbi:modulator of smoothened protein isoform X1 [Myotis daubentonii]|uniref:modulator of smoothened protein isoform X1 n=1 Tax=Myotis daubentonii TaxID=98922 RepID=UPI0028739C10|nr:modulator of smoothened protein isoform X1 [Myotis daubentonii]